jgi:hypothetical protein
LSLAVTSLCSVQHPRVVCNWAVSVICWITEPLQSLFVNALCHYYVICITFYVHQAWMCVRPEFCHVRLWLLWLARTDWMFWHCISITFLYTCNADITTLLSVFFTITTFLFILFAQTICLWSQISCTKLIFLCVTY